MWVIWANYLGFNLIWKMYAKGSYSVNFSVISILIESNYLKDFLDLEYCTHCWCKTPKQIVHWHFRVSRQNHTTTCLTAAYMIWLPLIFFRFVLRSKWVCHLKNTKGLRHLPLRVSTLFKDLFHCCVTHWKKAIFAKFSILHVFEGGAFDILKK